VSFNVAMLKQMQAEGLDLDACIRVLEAGEKKRDKTNAKRQARHRARKASNAVTVTPVTPPNENDNLTPTRDITPKPSGLVPKPKKHRLPADWEPKPFTPGTLAAQAVLRWEPGRLERELSKFRDHHTAAGTRWENWQAAWSKWVNNSEDFNRGGYVRQPGKSATAYASLVANIEPDEPF